jgi:hypothetical protein
MPEQTPSLPPVSAAEHASQMPLQGSLQQMPSTQLPDTQSAPTLHVLPLARTQWPCPSHASVSLLPQGVARGL